MLYDDATNSKQQLWTLNLKKENLKLILAKVELELFKANNSYERPDLSDFQIVHEEIIGNTPAMINHFTNSFELNKTPATTFMMDGWQQK